MKTFRIALTDGSHYTAQTDENLLAAAQRAHWLVRYGCRNGNCGACAATLLQGVVKQLHGPENPSQASEKQPSGTLIAAPAEKILLCLCQPLSDLQIALPIDPRPGSFDQAQRCYALLQRQISAAHASQLWFLLPAGRTPALHTDQIALIETDTGLLQAHIDHEKSHGRELAVRLVFESPLHEGAYYHVRYPLSTIRSSAPMPTQDSSDE